MSADHRIARHVVVRGRVQGVFYRDSCRREAEARGVTGWVRNEPDGTVAAVFEGPPDAVDAMVAWSRAGPPRAAVSDVEVHEREPAGLRGFQVR